jgi:hypothetical protein
MIRSGMWEPDRWGPIDGLPVALVTTLMKSRLIQRSLEEPQDRRPPKDITPDPALQDVGQGL